MGSMENITLEFHQGKSKLKDLVFPDDALEWSLDMPNLQELTVRTSGGGVVERFGLREWGHHEGRLTLNGEEIRLVGWNHHTQWPETAGTPTESQLDADIMLLKLGGANYVRGAHYPQDQR